MSPAASQPTALEHNVVPARDGNAWPLGKRADAHIERPEIILAQNLGGAHGLLASAQAFNIGQRQSLL